jgi:hypothetical protein
MKPVMHRVTWLSIFLVLVGMTCFLGIVAAQQQGRSDQPATPGGQAGEIAGQGRMGERGQMT